MTTFPSFLRFGYVQLWYGCGLQPIEAKCKLFELKLLQLKSALNESISLVFDSVISNNDQGVFNNQAQLSEYIHHQLTPICYSSRCYKFRIHLMSYESSATEVIASLLQIPEIKRCSMLGIELIHWGEQNQLPIETISNWLEQSVDGMEMENSIQKHRERSLTITIDGIRAIENVQEMLNHMKMVSVKT